MKPSANSKKAHWNNVLISSETEQENLIKYGDKNSLMQLVQLKGREILILLITEAIVKAEEEKAFRRDRRNQRESRIH